MSNPKIEESSDGVVLTVKVVPGASRTALCGLHGEAVKVRISAAPEKGKANKSLCEFISKLLGVKKNTVSVISGQTSPMKRICISGISKERLLNKLQLDDREGC